MNITKPKELKNESESEINNKITMNIINSDIYNNNVDDKIQISSNNSNNINNNQNNIYKPIQQRRVRGIRSMLKKSNSADYKKINNVSSSLPTSNMNIHVKRYDQNDEVSFDITPDDDELINSIYNSNIVKPNNNNNNIDNGSNLSQILSPKNCENNNMSNNDNIENLTYITPNKNFEIDNKLSDNNIQINKTQRINICNNLNINDYYEEEQEQHLNVLQVVKSDRDIESTINNISETSVSISNNTFNNILSPNNKNNTSNLTNKNTNISTSGSNIKLSKNTNNINVLNDRLLKKIKQVKTLEQELKDKNNLISRLKSSLDKLKNEIKENNIEKNPKFKTELSISNRKLKEKEDELLQKKKVMDNLVESYKEKINNLINTNEVSLEKIDKLEKKINQYKEQDNKFDTMKKNYEMRITSLESQLKSLNENFEREVKEKNKLIEKNNEFRVLLANSLNILMDLYSNKKKDKDNISNLNNQIISQLKLFFTNDEEEDAVDLNQNQINDNITNNNNNDNNNQKDN